MTGAAGEILAAWWLIDRGLTVEAHNVVVDGGELDLVVDDNGSRVVVEVRTIRGAGDPIDAIPDGKRRRVRKLAPKVGASRVDFIGVALRPDAFDIHWVPG